MTDSKQRFSTRVDRYVKYRPGYPPEVVDLVCAGCRLAPGARIADVGSGTGILTRLFLEAGFDVVGVEPNREMREAGERFLAHLGGFTSVDGSAEATTLDDASIELVIAGQAFHWFDQSAARREFARVLAPGGHAALVWNVRSVASTPFMTEYEDLIRTFGTDYERVSHKGVDEDDLSRFFAPKRYEARVLGNAQSFDYEGLEGRLLSSSYVPDAEDPRSEPMLASLRELFDRHAVDGRLTFRYDTKLYFGPLEG